MTRSNNYAALAGFGILSLAVSAIGGLVTATSLDGWYQGLNKPFFNPPDWVFGPVWTVLFAAMAVAAWWTWRHGPSPEVTRAMVLHAVQLVLNLAWSVVFFGLQAPGPAFFQLVVLWLGIAAMIKAYAAIDLWAARLMWPYLAWVSFAGMLNAAIWYLN